MKALLRSSVLALVVFAGYAAFVAPIAPRTVTSLPSPTCLPQPGVVQSCLAVR